MVYLLIAALVIFYSMQAFFCKLFTGAYKGDSTAAPFIYSSVTGLAIAALTFALSGFSFSASYLTLLLGLINAAVVITYNLVMVHCAGSGPYSIYMIFAIAGSIVVPSLVSAIFYGEWLSAVQYISIAVIIFAVCLVSSRGKTEKKASAGFILFCCLLALTNGLYASLLVVQQRVTGESEKDEMLIITFFFVFLGSFAALLIKRGKKTFTDLRVSGKPLVFLVACALAAALAPNLLVRTIPLVNVALLYTFENSGVFLLSVLLSVVCFKEKLDLKNAAGIVLMCAGLVCVSLF